MNKPVLLEIFYFDAGGGHRSAMNALIDVLSERCPHFRVKAVDLQELLKPVDLVYKFTKTMSPTLSRILKRVAPKIQTKPINSQDLYNAALKHGRTHGWGAMLLLLQLYIETKAPQIETLLQNHWGNPKNEKPDMVVSVIPNFNRVMFRALRTVQPTAPYITIMTDLIDVPPHFWMEDQNQHLICGTQKAHKQALKTGFYRPEKIYATSGMILKKQFYAPASKFSLAHEDIGFSPDIPTILIMFGGNGSLVSEKIVDQLENAKLRVQTIVMCGHNAELLQDMKQRKNCHAVGFVPNVHDYMRIADIFIGKPGPGSISEAIHMGCPVIVECNAATMPQERPNVDWVLENGVGIAVKSFKRGLAKPIRRMIIDLERYRRNIRNNVPQNRAVFEIADILERIAKANAKRNR